MATEVAGSVMRDVAAKLDTLDWTDEERRALAVVLAAGLDAGLSRETPEVEGFMPTAVEYSAPSFQGQLQRQEYLEVKFVYQQITWTYSPGGPSTSDSWDAPS